MKLFPIQFQIIVTHPYASTNNMHMLSSCLLLTFWYFNWWATDVEHLPIAVLGWWSMLKEYVGRMFTQSTGNWPCWLCIYILCLAKPQNMRTRIERCNVFLVLCKVMEKCTKVTILNLFSLSHWWFSWWFKVSALISRCITTQALNVTPACCVLQFIPGLFWILMLGQLHERWLHGPASLVAMKQICMSLCVCRDSLEVLLRLSLWIWRWKGKDWKSSSSF